MKPIIIYTPYNCLLKCGEQELELDENEHAIIEDNVNKINVYPTGKTKKYSFVIDLSEKNNKFYSIVEKDNKILIFLLDGLLSENVDIFHIKYSNMKCDIEISQDSISFNSDTHKKHLLLNKKPLSLKYGNFYHICYILLSFDDCQTLLAYNMKNNTVKQFKGENIVLTDNGFKIQAEKSFTFEKFEQEYYVDQEGLKNKTKTFLLSNTPEELVVYQFMQIIKNQDIEHIESFLSENLKRQVTTDKILNYFGKINYFYMFDNKSCFARSDEKDVLYEFIIKNGKIDEIIDNR